MKTPSKPSESRPSDVKKAKYRVTNWPEYDRAMVARGNIMLWFDEDFIRHHWKAEPTGCANELFRPGDTDLIGFESAL